ncbi:hypothetical protein [Klebsiella pneumoniae]|uniref:hypothetical protein n=1 Tax=Klebsiella pneumoniae TaxID=573 RepID=UPI003F8574CB
MKINQSHIDAFEKHVQFVRNYKISIRNDMVIDVSDNVNSNSISKNTNIIDVLNTHANEIFPALDKDIPVVFADFTVWSKFVIRMNKLLPFTSREMKTAYNVHDEDVHIFSETFNRDTSILYDFMLSKGCSSSITSTVIILHEIGHAVHHQTEKLNGEYLDLSTQEANFINKFTMFFQEEANHISMYETDTIIRNATREGFADLYCCILIDKLYSKKEATVAINGLKAYRDKYNKRENYYTAYSIARYIELREHDGLQASINSFAQLNKIISAIVSETAIKLLSQKAGDASYAASMNKSRFLGFINEVYELGNSDVDTAMKKMKEDLPVLKEFIENINNLIRYDYNPKEFDVGKNIAIFWKKNYLPLKPVPQKRNSSKYIPK